jgi:5-methylcytosine-specific restriction protein A
MKVDNTRFYKSAKWQKCRDAYRAAHPLCVNVEQCGNAMYYVDHIKPISEGGALFDWGNLQSLCVACNASKTGKQAHKKTADE